MGKIEEGVRRKSAPYHLVLRDSRALPGAAARPLGDSILAWITTFDAPPRHSPRPNSIFLGAVCTIALVMAAEVSQAAVTWTPRGAYADREFTSLVSPPNYPCVVAFTALGNGGLGVSTDCGIQFANLISTNAYAVTAKNENTGWVAAGTSGVVKSVNGGGSWFPVNAGLPVFKDARAIVVHLTGPDTIYVGLHGDGVYVGRPISDSLVSWQPMNVGLGNVNVRDLVRVRGGTFFLAATDGGIWRWSDGSWSLTGAGVVANAMVIDAADSNRVYAAGSGGVYRSFDAGQSFVPSSTGLPAGVAINDIARRTDLPDVLYVGTAGSGVYESLDFGATWHPFGPALPGDNDVRAILAVVETSKTGKPASVFAGTRANGLYEAEYSTPVETKTWGRLKASYR